MTFDAATRDQVVQMGAALYDRGLTPGRTGNISVRTDEAILITPTNACLGRLDPTRLAVTSLAGEPLEGDKPSKELVLHRALYRNHPTAMAVVHLHSPYAVTVSCLPDLDHDDALPPITPYYVMRVKRLPLVDYAAPGSADLEERVTVAANKSPCLLLRNHGSLAAATTLEAAADAVEEIEQTARLHLMLRCHTPSVLDADAVAELRRLYP